MIVAYNILIRIYYWLIRISSLLSPKAKAWIDGRKLALPALLAWKKQNQEPPVWMHCASTGEYEQGRPVLVKLKESYPDNPVIVTFFSPSGYQQIHDELIDLKLYLPIDTSGNMEPFIATMNPAVVFFVKYDFWYWCYVHISRLNIPFFHIAGVFPEKSYLYCNFGRDILKCVDHFFVQNQESKDHLRNRGYENVTVTGDPRVERVIEIGNTEYDDSFLDGIEKPIILYGSIWRKDWKKIRAFVCEDKMYYHVLAPHDLKQANIDYFKKETNNYDHITIDQSMGQLKFLYRFAHIAYVGGGFGSGIHNTLEPAVYGIPIIFGPHYNKFPEAKYFIGLGVAAAINNAAEMKSSIEEMETNISEIQDKMKSYFSLNGSNSEKIIHKVKEIL